MGAAADIKDRKSLEAWLKTQPREVCVLIAAREACRVLPFINLYKVGESPVSAIILPTSWAVSATLSAGRWPDMAVNSGTAAFAARTATVSVAVTSLDPDASVTEAVRNRRIPIDVARFAYDTADFVVRTEHSISDSAFNNIADIARVANDVTNDVATTYAVIRSEALAIDTLSDTDRAKSVYSLPLWPTSDDIDIQNRKNLTLAEWRRLSVRLSVVGSNASADIPWYDRILTSGFSNDVDYELARLSAFESHYDKGTKDKGTANINTALLEIEDQFFQSKFATISNIADQTPLAETVSFSEEMGVYNVESVPVIDLYARNLSRISDSLLSVISSNAFNKNSPEVKFIEDMIDSHKNDPQRLHDDCKYTHGHIQNLIAKKVVSNDFAVGRLLNALNQTMFDIVANDADVNKAVAARVTLKMNEQAHVSDATRLTDSVEQIANILSDVLKRDTRSDTQVLIAGDSARLNAAYRMLSRNSRIYLDINTREGVKAASVKSQPHLDELVEQLPNIERVLELLKPYLG